MTTSKKKKVKQGDVISLPTKVKGLRRQTDGQTERYMI